MIHSPDIHLRLARAREQELLRRLDRQALSRESADERPGALRRLAALRRRRRETRPATAAS